jgi:hypothetical protein
MAQQRFRIVGGTDLDLQDYRSDAPSPADVHREARRRLAAAKINAERIRALATGRDMPSAPRYLAMQIDFVARSLAALRPVPADFADDIYWPA